MTERFREISRNRPGSIVPPSEAADLIALPPFALLSFPSFLPVRSILPARARARLRSPPDRCPPRLAERAVGFRLEIPR